jgi:threonine dehydratase
MCIIVPVTGQESYLLCTCQVESVLNLAGVRKAGKAIQGIALHTPLIASQNLSTRTGHPVWLKLETLQPTGAFKIRGAANALKRLTAHQRKIGVVCCSTGNHGRAVAYVAAKLGVPATVCVSSLVPQNKVASIEELGAEVRRIGACQDDAQKEANLIAEETGAIDIPPFDHPAVIEGQGTIALEILQDVTDIDTILVPLSGGGLIGGIALAAKSLKPSIRVIGISMERAAMQASLAAGKPVEVEEVSSLADSLGGGIGINNRWTFDLCRKLVDDVVLLSEAEIFAGMRSLLLEDRIVAEGAGAVGVTAILAGKVKLKGSTDIVISGQNVDMQQLVARSEPVSLDGITVRG